MRVVSGSREINCWKEKRSMGRPGVIRACILQGLVRRVEGGASGNKSIGVTEEEPCFLARSVLNQAPSDGPTQYGSDDC